MKTICYLRTGRKLRATGEVISRYADGTVKVKPARAGWGCVLVTPAEIEAGKEKPAYTPRKKLAEAPDDLKPKRKRRPKPAPVPRWKQLVDRAHALKADMPMMPGIDLISDMAEEIEAIHARLEQYLPLNMP